MNNAMHLLLCKVCGNGTETTPKIESNPSNFPTLCPRQNSDINTLNYDENIMIIFSGQGYALDASYVLFS